MGTWLQRTPLSRNTASAFKIYDPHGYCRLVAASCIPLDIPSMGLDRHALWELKNKNFTRLKSLGGKIEFYGFRFMDNDVSTSTVKFIPSTSSPVDRKIMWKMHDRERDYNWSYIHPAAHSLATTNITLDTADQTNLKRIT